MRALVLMLLLAPTTASATDTWTSPLPGVERLDRTTGTPWRIHALRIDLCTDGVALRATRSDERQRTTSSFGNLVGADAAINGDFFSFTDYSTSGLAVGDGQGWPGTSDSSSRGFVAFGPERAELSPLAEVRGVEAWMDDAVGGNKDLVVDGVAMATNSGDFCTTRHPRTAAGISEDGRTLILAVVDGRTSLSVGMRCTELGDLMAELGAWDALNLDGGGSTTMWMSGPGVINAPSDGSQRTVANHLGLFSTGALERPGSCDRSLEGAALLVGAVAGSLSTDVDGDGLADLCGRGPGGVSCALAPDLGTVIDGPVLSDATGWGDDDNWSTLRFGDLDGDGRADLCARANAGIRCWTALGDGFSASWVGPPLSDGLGWSAPSAYGTLALADVTGDGRADLCGRDADGVRCWPSLGAEFGPAIDGPLNEAATAPQLSDALGWARPRYYGTLRWGDLTGDGLADLCARAAAGIRCWASTGAGFGPTIAGPEWSDANGWDALSHWSSVRLVDLDGDGRADLCGRDVDGVVCHLSTGDGFGPELRGPGWADANGWGDWSNASTLRFADLDGDGDQDVCARANAGLRCSLFDGAGFGPVWSGPDLADAGAWDLQRFQSTLRLADVTGDGRADLCGRAYSGVLCWPFDGTVFGDPFDGPAWGQAEGWGAPSAYGTLRLVQPPPAPPAGDDDDATGDDDDAADDDDASLDDDDASPDDDDSAPADDLRPPRLGDGGSTAPEGGCGCGGGGGLGLALLPVGFLRRRSSLSRGPRAPA
jgi:hypothetical protein